MNIFLKNSWVQKLIIAIVIVLLFNFIYPHYSNGYWNGGTLIKPITQLVLFIGDTILGLLQYAIMGDHKVIVQMNDDFWDDFWGIVAIGGLVVAGFFTGGSAWVVAAGLAVAVVRRNNGRSRNG